MTLHNLSVSILVAGVMLSGFGFLELVSREPDPFGFRRSGGLIMVKAGALAVLIALVAYIVGGR